MPPYDVGTFFKHTSGDLYLLVNTGRCPMLVGVSSGNRWADDYYHVSFIENFKVSNEYEWGVVTSDQRGAFTKVNVRIDGLTITPSWEV